MIIYVARHGQTTGDVENRYGGSYDDHITQLGKQQANELADLLDSKNIKKLYSSPLKRARETAEIVRDKLGLRVKRSDGFKERNTYGKLSGLTKSEAALKYPDEVAKLNDPRGTVEGAEEYDALKQRVTAELEKWSRKHKGNVAVITHAGPLRLIFRDILKLGEIEVADCAYAAIEVIEGKYKLVGTVGIIVGGLHPVK